MQETVNKHFKTMSSVI